MKRHRPTPSGAPGIHFDAPVRECRAYVRSLLLLRQIEELA